MPKKGEDRWFDINVKEAGFPGDPSDAMAQQKSLYIDFYHTPSKNSMAFKAFITEYSETYELNYEEQDVFGRADAFSRYKNTRRRISLAWETVAASKEEAEQNMKRCSELIQMMYPSYENYKLPKGVALHGMSDNPVIASEPVFRIRFSHWLVDPAKGSNHTLKAFSPADSTGVWCRITNFQYAPDLEEGSFDTANGVFPKVIKLNCAIVPYMPEGYWNAANNEKKGAFKYFPFGYDGITTERKGPPENKQGIAKENSEAEEKGVSADMGVDPQ